MPTLDSGRGKTKISDWKGEKGEKLRDLRRQRRFVAALFIARRDETARPADGARFKLYRNATVFGDLVAKNGGKLVLIRVQASCVALCVSVASCDGLVGGISRSRQSRRLGRFEKGEQNVYAACVFRADGVICTSFLSKTPSKNRHKTRTKCRFSGARSR